MFRLVTKNKIEGLAQAARELNAVDKGIIRQLRKDLGKELRPIGREIAREITATPPLSGMNHQGRSGWTQPKSSIIFRPTRKAKGTKGTPIVSLKMTGRNKMAGFDIAELAGARNLQYSKNVKKGRAFVQNIKKRSSFPNYKAGRFGYGEFLKKRREMEKISVKIIDEFARKFNKKVKRFY